MILLVLLLSCYRRRRGKNDVECSGSSHPEGQQAHCKSACRNHNTCNRNGGKPQTGQKTPSKPFILKLEPVTSTERPQEHHVTFNPRDSVGSQKSAGSDTSTDTLCLSDSNGFQRGARRSQKRPPPLKLNCLITPVINGPRNNPRARADRFSPPSPRGVPTIVVHPPQSATSDRRRRP